MLKVVAPHSMAEEVLEEEKADFREGRSTVKQIYFWEQERSVSENIINNTVHILIYN